MGAAEFAGWAWAIAGAVCAGAVASLVVVSIIKEIRKQMRGPE